jgi:hypothetical protein
VASLLYYKRFVAEKCDVAARQCYFPTSKKCHTYIVFFLTTIKSMYSTPFSSSFSPCLGYQCMEFANCADISNEADPQVECLCQLGRIKDATEEERKKDEIMRRASKKINKCIIVLANSRADKLTHKIPHARQCRKLLSCLSVRSL